MLLKNLLNSVAENWSLLLFQELPISGVSNVSVAEKCQSLPAENSDGERD
jgi:hypothetical protein